MSIANGAIEVGDTVRVRRPALLRTSIARTFTVLSVKSYDVNETPFWSLLSIPDGELIIIDSEVVLQVLD